MSPPSPLGTPVTSPSRGRFGSPGSASGLSTSPGATTSPNGHLSSLRGRGDRGRDRDRDREVPPISTSGRGIARDPRFASHLVTSPASASSSGSAAQTPTPAPSAATATSASTLARVGTTPTPTSTSTSANANANGAGPARNPLKHADSAPAARTEVPQGLLVPTDRPLDEFEAQWLPRLGRLRVDREVEMRGYALYGIRSWYLSRTHWLFTIVAYTGKPTDVISCYVLVPAAELTPEVGKRELHAATQMLAGETRAQTRKTDEGTLLVSAPAAHGQEIWPIPQGDLREAWPFIVLNTALRRLGCGGRAAMGNDVPVAAVRRKFYESYRIPLPGGGIHSPPGAPSRANSPPQSPIRPHGHSHSQSHSLAYGLGHARSRSSNLASGAPRRTGSPSSRPSSESEGRTVTAAALERDPLMLSTVELVKLIQAALAIWGFYGTKHEEIEIDGLFCDETKAAISKWRTAMGMEREDSLKLEKETSGGCIDPRTLAVLLSSVTSARYQLGVLGIEKLPKDPFSNVRRFLAAWRHYQSTLNTTNKPIMQYLSVQGIRQLNSCYVVERRGHASDALKVHKLLFSGVGSVASGVSAVVKGGGTHDDATPARKREQHIRFKGREEDCGVGMIMPEGTVGTAAAPDVITSDLEAYVKGVLKSREKDWDVMGARHIAELWSGRVAEGGEGRQQSRLRVFSRRSQQPVADTDDDMSLNLGTSAIGTIRGAAGVAAGAATGAIKGITKGGLRVVGRRSNTYDTSDSEGGGKLNLTAAQAYSRRQLNAVPTVVEPTDNMDDAMSPVQPHPDYTYPASASPRPSAVNHSLSHQSMRFSMLGGGNSDSDWERAAPDRRRSVATTVRSATSNTPSTWAPRRVMLLRTASDGADVVADNQGLEWAVANGHGTGKRLDADASVAGDTDDLAPSGTSAAEAVGPLVVPTGVDALRGATLRRSHSLQDRAHYRGMHVCDAHHLAVDVGMCEMVWNLRKRERLLAKRAADMAILERSAFMGTQTIFDTARARRDRIEALENEVRALRADLGHAAEGAVDDDRALRWASDKILFCLSEDTNTSELSWQLRELEKHWEAMGDEMDRERRVFENGEKANGVRRDRRGSDGAGRANGQRRGWWPWS